MVESVTSTNSRVFYLGRGYRPWRNGLMQKMPIQELSGPFSLLVVDAVGPLVTTPRGNKFILVFADYFTRWVNAFLI
ncbi:LOW QUALITY PROTEIN: Gag-pol Polyprotein [Phytophthora megakarya]|uniref:Gag-pol Polyprotein n=1 Tax=Phytophthora megakarya TaxID=4795 RepID=A0A225VID4_9STRA|nr:LOW QUALITY PROTEIN: Gag-pol Polyprotein [Phytophthora megakarya]